MNKLISFFAASLLLASASAWSETATDLTYCLQLKSNLDIAKCAGEVSAGNKGRTMSRAEVESMLEQEKAPVPAGMRDATAEPAVESPAPDTTNQIR